ncbi:hypothetical protein D3C85_1907670 [compost metagenome]
MKVRATTSSSCSTATEGAALMISWIAASSSVEGTDVLPSVTCSSTVTSSVALAAAAVLVANVSSA